MTIHTLSPHCTVEIHDDVDGGVVAELHGNIVVRTVQEVRRVLDEAVARRPRTLSIDLEQISDIDVAGLAAVTAPAMRARRDSIDVTIAPPRSPLARQLVDRVGVVPMLNRAGR